MPLSQKAKVVSPYRGTPPARWFAMFWGQGDGSGLRAVDSAVRRGRSIGVLRALQSAGPIRLNGQRRADPLGDVPGVGWGDIFSEQTQVNIRQYALESGC